MPHLNLDHQRKRAKALLKGVRAHDPQALQRLRTYGAISTPAKVSLTDAQRVVARESGFQSWAGLKAQIRAECLAHPLMRATLYGAAHRACETELAHPLYRDPYARALAGEDGWSLLAAMRQTVWPGYGATGPHPCVSIVTKFFDDALQRVVEGSEIRQVVMLGGGTDTRAFRLRWPSELTIFEVDRPGLFAHKEQVLDRLGARPACRRQTVAADPHGSWVRALIRRGWDAARPTAFLPNGLDYVSNGSADRLVRQITAVAAAGSWIGFAINSEATRRSPFFTAFIAKQQVLGFPQWTFGLDDPDAWLAAYGWTSTSIVVGAPEANYGRWPLQYVPREIPAVPRTFLTEGWRGREETRCESQ